MYKKYIEKRYVDVEEKDVISLENRTGVELHPEHKKLLIEINGGACRSDQVEFDRTIVFPIDDSSSLNLRWMICESPDNGNVPFAENGNEDIVYISPQGMVLVHNCIIANNLLDFFQKYFRML